MELLLLDPKETPASLAERLDLAHLLHHDEILLLFPTHDANNQKLVAEARERSALRANLTTALFVTDANRARSFKKHYRHIAATASRAAFESRDVTLILDPETSTRDDFMHHRNSGLNQVLLAFAKQRGQRILTTTRKLLDANKPDVLLGRMRQNSAWCAKYGVPYDVVSGARTLWEQRDAKDLQALERVLPTL